MSGSTPRDWATSAGDREYQAAGPGVPLSTCCVSTLVSDLGVPTRLPGPGRRALRPRSAARPPVPVPALGAAPVVRGGERVGCGPVGGLRLELLAGHAKGAHGVRVGLRE